MGKKATNAELEARVNQVYMLLLSREPREKILEYARSQWGVKRASADNYIARAKQRMVEVLRQDRETMMAQAVAELDDLYRLSYKAQRYWDCLNVAKERNKLLMLYEADDTTDADVTITVKRRVIDDGDDN